MDHSLEDSLNLESAMGEMDFESAEDVASQAGISLDPSQDSDMAMEFEHIEEQPILMDSGSEEIIVTDFMGDQFNLQEYSIHDDQTTGMTTTEDSNQQDILASQSDSLDIKFESQNVPMKLFISGKQKYISVKAAPPTSRPTFKKAESAVLTTVPRQIAIAPKPPRLVPAANRLKAIAPRPIAVVKKPMAGVIQGDRKGNTVLAQIGKPFVVMPSGSSQKIKLVTSGAAGMPTVQYIKAGSDQAQLIPSKNVTGMQTNKPITTKLIVQGQPGADASNQPAVITKLLPPAPARYVMHKKAMPIITNQVIMGSPTKHGVKFTKKHEIISIKSPPSTSKLLPVPTSGSTTKKVVIPANPAHNVILKTTAPPKAAQLTKDGKVVLQGQRSQLHQINVPGKGIQYIRLITNQSPAVTKTVAKPQASAGPPKSFVLSDGKGNLIQVTGKAAAQPPPLLFTVNADKLPQKLVRIAAAPMSAKSTPVSQPVTVRSAQSLLAPLVPNVPEPAQETQHEHDGGLLMESEEQQLVPLEEYSAPESPPFCEVDSKAALQALIADDVQPEQPEQLEQPQQPEQPEQPELPAQPAQPVNIKQQRHSSDESEEDSNSMEHLVPIGSYDEHPLIVISSNYMTQGSNNKQYHNANRNMQNVETDPLDTYQPSPPAVTDGDVITGDLGLKPRRACNCTKSQCLKLYCDCFANGEFCNRCNCNNCHNNLDNEELRQKAIRACLERNPNAFRPKIGKTKAGGPEIIRRHNKGCNCKRSGCLKNYCECYEAVIACTAMCKCVGCRNVGDGLPRRRPPQAALYRPPPPSDLNAPRQPCSFMTAEVIEAVCQCLIAASVDSGERPPDAEPDPVRDVIEEFSRCLQDVISASHQAPPQLLDEGQA